MTVTENRAGGRRWRNFAKRRGGFVAWRTGRGLDDAGRPFKIPARSSASRLVELSSVAGLETVMLCGPLPGVGRDRLRQWAYGLAGAGKRALPAGWDHGRHYWPDSGAPVLRYEGPEGRRLEVHLAESWFGDNDLEPEAARHALELVAVELAGRARGCPRLATPVQTGLAAMDRLVDTDREPWPEEFRELIRATSPQHRMEWVAGDRELPEIVELDMHLAYGALCWGLGAGHPQDFGGFDPNRRAWYQGWATVPEGWDRPGLLPLRDTAGVGWEWPAEPGRRFFFFADGAEVNVAVRSRWVLEQLHGWAPADSHAKPLDRWARELVNMAERFELSGERHAYEAARAILLQGVGGLVGRPGRVYGVLPFDRAHEIPAGALAGSVRRLGEVITWAEEVPTSRGDLEHPEWAAAIWGRCRARLLWKADGSGTLNYRPDLVAGFRGDAVYLEALPAEWPTGRRAGAWQTKNRYPGPHRFAGLPAFDRYRQRQRRSIAEKVDG